MNNFLIKCFIKNCEDIENTKVRDSYGKLSGIIGIIVNVILCIAKILTGIIFGSIAILADGINNLSDAGNSIVTLIGFKLASKPADKDHPFGHARFEYIAGLLVSFLIMMLGLNLLKDSFLKIFRPDPLNFSMITVYVLIFSIVMKLFLYSFNRKIAKKINSVTVMATAKDSLNDVVSTLGVLISVLIGGIFEIQIDAYAGLLVSAFVIYSGFGLINETLSPLLGEAPKEELIILIENKIKNYPSVIGIHDLVVHNYGYNKCFATVHVEIPANQDILYCHDIIDNIENEFWEMYNIQLVIHMDPVETDNPKVNSLKEFVTENMKELYPEFSLHDFRVAFGDTHNNVIFDVLIPNDCKLTTQEITDIMDTIVKKENPKNNAVIKIDISYIK